MADKPKDDKKTKVRSIDKVKVLIADDDRGTARRIVDFLEQHGFDAKAVYNGKDAKTSIVNFRPDLVLADLMLPQANAFDLIRYVNGEPALANRGIGFLVLSSHNNPDNISEAFRRGAKDYIHKPFMYPDLLNRLVLHCRDGRELEPLTDADLSAHWQMTELLLQQALQPGPADEVMFKLVVMAARKIKGNRCSLVRAVTHTQGVVVASSDDRNVSGLALDLVKYPEIQLVMNTGKMIAIENLENSRALKKIKSELKSISFNSLIVCPVYYRQKPFGVLSMRMPSTKQKLTDEEIRFVDVVAKIASLSLGGQNISDMSRFGLISA
jgi:DNA-binding response OmpR family regulator